MRRLVDGSESHFMGSPKLKRPPPLSLTEKGLRKLSRAFDDVRDAIVTPLSSLVMGYHFTRRDTARSILQSRVLWASDLRVSKNDKNELSSGFGILRQAIEGSSVISEMGDQIPELLRGLCYHAACLSSEWSTERQWTDFADGGTGWAIGFALEPMNKICIKLNIQHFPINYDVPLQLSLCRDYLATAENLPWEELSDLGRREWYDKMLLGLGTLAFASKSADYSSERELRLCITCDDAFKKVPNLSYCARELPLCTSQTLREVVLGAECDDSVEEVAQFLQEHGYGKVVVRRIDKSLLR